MTHTFVLRNREHLKRLGTLLRDHWEEQADVGRPLEVIVREYEPRRTSDANALMWALLSDLSRQVEWHGQHLAPEDWKDMFSASLRRQRVVPAIDGPGFVVLGQRTSRMTKSEFSDLIELIRAFGAERGVHWSEREEMA